MNDFTAGDLFFIVLILGFIHAIMVFVGFLRRRKAARRAPENSPADPP